MSQCFFRYISDIIPKVKRFSKKLDDLILIKNQSWIPIEDFGNSKTLYVFLDGNELLISKDGIVTKEKYVVNKELIKIPDIDKRFIEKLNYSEEDLPQPLTMWH